VTLIFAGLSLEEQGNSLTFSTTTLRIRQLHSADQFSLDLEQQDGTLHDWPPGEGAASHSESGHPGTMSFRPCP